MNYLRKALAMGYRPEELGLDVNPMTGEIIDPAPEGNALRALMDGAQRDVLTGPKTYDMGGNPVSVPNGDFQVYAGPDRASNSINLGRMEGPSPPAQGQEKLGEYVTTFDGRKGRYSQDGRSVVLADGTRVDLFPQASAAKAKADFEAKKQMAELSQREAQTQQVYESMNNSRFDREEKMRERQLLEGAGAAPQSILEKRYGKAPEGKRWSQDGTLEDLPGGVRQSDAKDVLGLLEQAVPLVKQSTGSMVGTGVDKALGAVGVSTEGSQAAAKLKVLEGALISKMPKMSGPQSDKDVLLYKQMAGMIGDSTIPPEQKLAAMDTIREINSRYLGQQSQPQVQPQPQQPTGVPKTGEVRTYNGQRWMFMGGNPSDQSRWKPA